MKKSGKCPKCESTDVIADAKAIDRTQGSQLDMTIATFRKPDALLFKHQRETTVSAWVCGSCGFVELYADEPSHIKIEKV